MPNYNQLKLAVKKITGKPALSLTVEEAKLAKEKRPKDFLAYQKLRKTYTADWKALLQSFVGQKLVPYAKLAAKFKSAGYTDVLSEGFEGFVDNAGKMYTKNKELLNGAPRFAFYPKIKMNPNYGKRGGDNWVCQGVKVDGTAGGYFYTTEFFKAQSKKKFARVRKLDLPAIRKKWLPQVRKFDITSRESVASIILELLWQFTARVGTPGNTTLGVATLLVRNATATSTGITLRYKGKDEVNTVHKLVNSNIEHRPLIAALRKLMANKVPKDNLFTLEKPDGTRGKVMSVSANRHFHKCGAPADVRVHKIRTWRGTQIFNAAIEPVLANPPANLAEAKRLFKAAAEQVGKALNHVRRTQTGDKVTGATALGSYVDSDAQIRYWKTLGYPLPPKLAKAAQS